VPVPLTVVVVEKPSVPSFTSMSPLVTFVATKEIRFAPTLVSLWPARFSVAVVLPRMSQRAGPPIDASPLRVTKRKALICEAPELTIAPLPPTPVPAMVTSSAPRFWPLTSRVPPPLTKVPPAVVPRAVAEPALRVPPVMVTLPV